MRIEAQLAQTLDAATAHDTILLTFSGHGTHNHRLVAHDTSLSDLADTTISMASLAPLRGRSIGADLVRLYQSSLPDAAAYLRRANRALIVAAWLEAMPMETLEQTYTNSPFVPISYGDVRRIVDATRFHLRSVVPIVQALHPGLLLEDEALDELTTRLEVGLPAAALPLLAVPTLTRGEILLLVRQAITQPAVAWAVVEPVATKLFGAARAQQLTAVWPPLPSQGVS